MPAEIRFPEPIGPEPIQPGSPREEECDSHPAAVATWFPADRGLVVLHGVRGSSIAPSARDGFTSKVGIDATKPLGADPAMFDKATL